MPAMLLFIVFLTSHWSHGDAQSCLPCIASQCSLDVSTCTHGAVKDYCGCCDECLKGPGEKCGGFFGSCANGSECIVRVGFGVSYILYVQTPGFCEEIVASTPLPSPIPTQSSTASTSVLGYSSCFSSTSASVESSSLSPVPSPTPIKKKSKKSLCRPPCSKELCSDGRNRYCSANSTMSEPRNIVQERIPCQHTTCLACHFIVDPDCSSCPIPVTKRCLRHFYLCLAEHYKRTDIFLEMSDPRVQTAKGFISCDVPRIEEIEDGSGDG